MESDVVTQDTSVRVVEKVSNRVESKKTVVQRTTNTNTTQVNRYDAEGNLKASEVDSSSWEDRDTQSYEWANKDDPPPEAITAPPTDDRIEKFFAVSEESGGVGPQQGAMVLTSSERRDVPAVSWSGASYNEEVDESKDTEHRTKVKMDGSQWSRSGESVWISPVSKQQPTTEPAKAVTAANGPLNVTNDDPDSGNAALSVEERRRRRCMENRSRRAASNKTERERCRQPVK